ncbi:hypothetical protein ABH20_12890 [Geobacillus sp. T6]|nr:hypothetical protein A0V43_06160 [Geobacillus sp. JS12]KLR73091.1 hypothetical protein ABH20_12890 [Geobacillus sp. T6]
MVWLLLSVPLICTRQEAAAFSFWTRPLLFHYIITLLLAASPAVEKLVRRMAPPLSLLEIAYDKINTEPLRCIGGSDSRIHPTLIHKKEMNQ